MDFITIYTTASSKVEAEQISRTLIERRLIACANIIGDSDSKASVASIYRWQGEIQQDNELVLLCKTRRDLFSSAADCIREVHSYDVPCIVAWPIVEIDSQYAAWIKSETQPIA